MYLHKAENAIFDSDICICSLCSREYAKFWQNQYYSLDMLVHRRRPDSKHGSAVNQHC